MANINATPVRLNNGRVLTITKSATAYIVLNCIPGSFKWKEPLRERIRYSDGGTQQTPLEGDDNLASLSFEFQAPIYISGDIRDKLMAAGTSGLVNTFDSVEVKVPAYRGGSTGHKLTLANAWLAEGVDFDEGAGTNGLDKMGAKIECKAADWAWTTY